jgi:hypothetical protein
VRAHAQPTDRFSIAGICESMGFPGAVVIAAVSDFFINKNLVFRYEPFPIGYVSPMVESSLYAAMTANWPAQELFEYLPRLGNKYTLSAKCKAAQYRAFIAATPIWQQFDRWVRGPDFVPEIMHTLLQHHLDLGYRTGLSWPRQTMKNLLSALRGRASHRGARFTATWEFQMMPGQGGHILPHTDTPSKIVTMTLSILNEGEWDPQWGGGIDVNRPKSERHAYNQLNQQADFADMEIVDTLGFTPNAGIIFLKTFNSWHSVRPMQATHPGSMRRNLIINIKTE